MTEQRYQLVCRRYYGRLRSDTGYSMFTVNIHGAIHLCAELRMLNVRAGTPSDCWYVPL